VLEAGTSNNNSSSSKSGEQQQQHTENLGQTSIELMMLAIVRYVRHLDTTVHALHIKTRLCQLVEAMMKRRDDLAFRSGLENHKSFLIATNITDWTSCRYLDFFRKKNARRRISEALTYASDDL
jgi:hypothetical protein